jgi:nucleoside-diphosphate-sugar epimerase
MRVFITGASGFIGTAVVAELIGGGHKVLGLARSDDSARALAAAGAEPHRGSLEDIDSLRAGAAKSDGVIHLGFIHDFAKYLENCEIDRRAIEAMGSVLVGSARPFIVTSGITAVTPGRNATEEDPFTTEHPRAASDQAADAVANRGVHVSVVCLPQVHDRNKFGLISPLIEIARAKGISAYVDDGSNRWPAAHLLDTAHLYVLALEKNAPKARYHAVGEEGVRVRDIAETIGRGLKVPTVSLSPDQANEHFGWLGFFIGRDATASSALTQKWLGWRPVQRGMIADLAEAHTFEN